MDKFDDDESASEEPVHDNPVSVLNQVPIPSTGNQVINMLQNHGSFIPANNIGSIPQINNTPIRNSINPLLAQVNELPISSQNISVLPTSNHKQQTYDFVMKESKVSMINPGGLPFNPTQNPGTKNPLQTPKNPLMPDPNNQPTGVNHHKNLGSGFPISTNFIQNPDPRLSTFNQNNSLNLNSLEAETSSKPGLQIFPHQSTQLKPPNPNIPTSINSIPGQTRDSPPKVDLEQKKVFTNMQVKDNPMPKNQELSSNTQNFQPVKVLEPSFGNPLPFSQSQAKPVAEQIKTNQLPVIDSNKPKVEDKKQASPNESTLNSQKKNQEEASKKQLSDCHEMINILKDSLQTRSFLQNKALNEKLLSLKQKKYLNNFICERCQNFYVKLELECGHSICLQCFVQRLKTLIQDRKLESLNEIRCEHCSAFFSEKDVLHALGENSQEYVKFSSLTIKKRCIWCKRDLNVFKSFFYELSCLHLCSECYTCEVYYGGKACFGCGDGFNNINITLMRRATCIQCKSTGLLVTEGFRALHDDHRFCYNCITAWVHSKSNECPFCNEDIAKHKSALLNFFNKYCIECKTTQCVSELKVCNKCQHLTCESCYELKNPHTCSN